MKKFEDIKWKQHRIGKGSIQGLLMLDNGIELSVVAGPTMYSLPRDAGNSPDDFEKFEVAIIDNDGNFLESDAGPVLGWKSREDINQLILAHA